jgi:hypothetical protein
VQDGKDGFIGRNGNIIIEPQYAEASSFSEDLAIVRFADDEAGVIDVDGNVVARLKGKDILINPFNNGLAMVVIDNVKVGYINTSGDYVREPVE